MVKVKFQEVGFTYSTWERAVLSNVSFTIEEGEFVVLIGTSGSGKSTLLKQLKKELLSNGLRRGEIYVDGKSLEGCQEKDILANIGYVFQNPENQIVTNKVWRELAFGLENYGVETNEIRRRVGEVVNYLNIQSIFREETHKLSGGQKQIVNLASVIAMQPTILLLDEPTAQLDAPHAQQFLQILKKINEELGMTIIIIDHRLEDVLPLCNRVLLLEHGELSFNGSPEQLIRQFDAKHRLFPALPIASRLYRTLHCKEKDVPITLLSGRKWISKMPIEELPNRKRPSHKGNVVLEAKELSFAYDYKSKEVVQQLSLQLYENEIVSIVGGNGAGKTTACKVLSGLLSSSEGTLLLHNKNKKKYREAEWFSHIGYVPQDIDLCFSCETVREEFEGVCHDFNRIQEMMEKFDVHSIASNCPYDLSGGEKQKVAIIKAILKRPSVLFLDEPTKGLDATAKENLVGFLLQCKKSMSIILVTHDLDFSAEVSDRVGLYFDCTIISMDDSRDFFKQNAFYTTAARRLTRGIVDEAVTYKDVLNACN